jgi:hypothetical protein
MREASHLLSTSSSPRREQDALIMSRSNDLRSVSKVGEWWKGFNAPALQRRCSTDWRRGFNDARHVERRLNAKAKQARQTYNPALCVNCFEPIPASRSISALTCCGACQQIAEGVRGLRRWVNRPGNILNMDEIDQRQRFVCCAVSKDGYDRRARVVSSELRQRVFARAEYKCELCGRSQGNTYDSILTIQHMRGASNDPMDLKAYCRQCNTIASLRFVTPRKLANYSADQLARLNLVDADDSDALREPHIEVLMREIELRVSSPLPMLPCDDANAWKERSKELQAERRDYDPEDDFDEEEDPELYVWPYFHSGEPW